MLDQNGYNSIINNTARMRDWVKGEPGIKGYGQWEDQLAPIRQTLLFQSEYVRKLAHIPFDLYGRFMSTFRLNLLYKICPAHLMFMRRTLYPVKNALMNKEMLVFDDATGTIELVPLLSELDALLGAKNYSVQTIPCSSPAFQGMIIRSNKKKGEVNKTAMDVLGQEMFGHTLFGAVVLSHADCD